MWYQDPISPSNRFQVQGLGFFGAGDTSNRHQTLHSYDPHCCCREIFGSNKSERCRKPEAGTPQCFFFFFCPELTGA